MPNWVINKLKIEADEKLTDEILETIKNDEFGKGTIDFNKVIPMPEGLNIEAGSRSLTAIELYRTMQKNGITYQGDGNYEFADPESMETSPKEFLDKYAATILDDPGIIGYGKTCLENSVEFGAPTWYEWCPANWGTKWNACHQEHYSYEEGSGQIVFETAWDGVPKIVKQISEMFPEASLTYRYADEDLSYNLCKMEYAGGESECFVAARLRDICLDELAARIFHFA
jgi:hypothetical protein